MYLAGKASRILWIETVLTSSSILSFTLFCLLEVNGRYVSLALFHFEYISSSTSASRRRRNLIASPYGASVETFTSPMTINSEDEIQLMHEKRTSQPRSLSPSPTYHTFDSLKTNNMVWPGSGSTDGKLTRNVSRSGFLSEPPIPIDLTLHGSLPIRRSLAFAANLLENDGTNASTSAIYSSAQLQSRPISDVPDVPSKTRTSFYDFKNITAPLVTAPMAAKAMLDNRATTHSAPHNFAVNMVNPTIRFKSTSALPFESATRAHSMVDLACYSTTAVNSDDTAQLGVNSSGSVSLTGNNTTSNGHTPHQSTDTTGRLSVSSLPEHPPPAWCPQTLKSAPLSADPAIRRLTELQSRSRSSMVRKSRIGAGRRKGSLSAFEFGFGPGGRRSAMSTTGGPGSVRDRDTTDSMSLVLSAFPATPTPLARKRAEESRKKEKGTEINIHSDAINKDNRTPRGAPTVPNASTIARADRPLPLPKSGPPKKDRVINRGRARAESTTSTSGKGSYSIMPPVTGRRRGNSSVSSSALGLGIEGVNVPLIVVVPNGQDEALDEKAAKRLREKKIVERGRYEKLPR